MFFKKAAVLGLAVAGAYGAQIQKRDGAHGHAHAAAAPASGYGAPAPATGYGAPDTSYAAPDTGYGAPDAGYAAPDTGYGAPDTGYEAAPAYGADDAAVGPGILPFVAVILAIIGLSLLFPAVVNVESRRKRSLAEGKNHKPFCQPSLFFQLKILLLAVLWHHKCCSCYTLLSHVSKWILEWKCKMDKYCNEIFINSNLHHKFITSFTQVVLKSHIS